MHQTFYIDSDEEISSVIDKLKKSLTTDNYFVVPKRAIFLQSIVNLKLLKREADKIKKQIILVTQDELGKNMAERAGISVQSTFESVDQVLPDANDDSEEFSEEVVDSVDDKKNRLKQVGSNDFYGKEEIEIPVKKQKEIKIASGKRIAKEKIVLRADEKIKPRYDHLQEARLSYGQNLDFRKPALEKRLDTQKEKKLEKIFLAAPPEKHERNVQSFTVGKRIKKLVWIFVLLGLISFGGVMAFLFVPKADITVFAKPAKIKVDADLIADAGQNSVDQQQAKIPLKSIEAQENMTITYDSTGSSNSSSEKKAHGTVTIYNEYSNSSQQLVATTRLETAEGKIFRLTKNVTVPGTKDSGGKTSPGTVDAEVVADESGESYNIDSTDFTVPGFKGGPKFEKFYAKTKSPMTGGIGADEKQLMVSQKDIDEAQKDAQEKITEKLKESLKSKLDNNDVLSNENIKISFGNSSSLAKAGQQSKTFDYTIEAKAQALVFSKADVEEIVTALYKKEGTSEIKSMKIDYAGAVADFDKKNVSMKLHGEVSIDFPFTAEELKKEFLGKDQQQITEVVKKYPQINNVTFEFQPKFISSVPQYSQRVNLQLKAD